MTYNYNNTTNESSLDTLALTEMCDICAKSYHYSYIRRIPYIGKNGYTYIIRCCPYCKIDSLTQYL